MVGTGEVVVVLLVVLRPVLRVRHGRRRTRVGRDGLRVVQHFDLHRVVMAMAATVVGAIVVLVPVLVSGTAEVGRVVGEGDDGPVLPQQPVAGVHDAGRVDHIEDFRNDGGGDVALGAERGLLLLVDGVVDGERDAEVLRCEHHQAAACEVPDQGVRLGVREARTEGLGRVFGSHLELLHLLTVTAVPLADTMSMVPPWPTTS